MTALGHDEVSEEKSRTFYDAENEAATKSNDYFFH